jgi:hypothetical protein
MKGDERESQRKPRALEHSDLSGNVRETCRYFGRASFYRWQATYRQHVEYGWIIKKPIP